MAAAVLGGMQAQAQMYGGADSAFGTNGLKTVDFGTDKDYCRASVLDRFGRIWLGGYNQAPAVNSAFTRLDTLGNLSPNFKNNGKSVIDFNPNGNEGIFAMAIDANDRVYAAAAVQGAVSSDILVFRMNLEGVLDTNFGDKGAVIHELTIGAEAPHSMVIDENNLPVIIGQAAQLTSDIFVLRLLENGDRDSSFSTDGVVFLDPQNVNNTPAGIAIRPLAAGGGYYVLCFQNQLGGTVATLTSISNNGNLNIDLGGPGILNYRKSGFSTTPQSVLWLAGDIYIAGTFKGVNGNQDAFISCIQTNGKLKTTYGDSGSVVTTLSPANLDNEAFYKILAASDSSIYAAGTADQNGGNFILTAHFDKAGNKVGLFGNGGGYHKTALPNGSLNFMVFSVELDEKRGRLYVSGSSDLNSDIDFFAYAFKTKATVASNPNAVFRPEATLLELYPNPNAGEFYLQNGVEGEVALYSLSGQLQAKTAVVNGQVSLPQSLNNGVYFLRLIDGNTVYTAKVNLIR